MINSMNTRLNTLSWHNVKAIEKIEHGLSNNPTKKQFMLMQSAEHELKKPTMSQLLKVETKEHAKPESDEEDDDEEEDKAPEQQNYSLGKLVIRGKTNAKS